MGRKLFLAMINAGCGRIFDGLMFVRRGIGLWDSWLIGRYMVSRLRWMQYILTGVCLTCLMVAPAGANQDGMQKALVGLRKAHVYFDLRAGEPQRFIGQLMLINQAYEQLEESGLTPWVVIGIRGPASKFVSVGTFLPGKEGRERQATIRTWFRQFKEMGITIEQCAIAAEIYDITAKDLLAEVELVENSIVSMIGYQHQGYALVPFD